MKLYSDEQIELARHRISNDPDARKISDSIVAKADAWLTRDDESIRDIMPEAAVPRTWTVNFVTGCPTHGSGPENYGGYAQGGWEHDPFISKWQVTCGVGGETYPGNDFGAFYDGGMVDRSLLQGAYADDGWGWQGDDSINRHWFVAYCCNNTWRIVVSGLTDLAHAYLLTTDARYAHKGLVILDRLSEVYPAMDYAKQSMYALEFSPGYTGKMFDLISESGNARKLCEAVDILREAIPGDPVFGPRSEQVREKIETGIVGASMEGVYRGQVRSNYGGHQEALLLAAIVSDDKQQIEKAMDWVLNNTGEATELKEMLTHFDGYIFRDKAAHAEGINFALDNLIFREGIGWESSPSYNNGWVVHLTNIAEMLVPLGVNLWNRPKFRRMYRWAAEMQCADKFVPAVGDAGSATGGSVGLGYRTLAIAHKATGDPFIGELMRQANGGLGDFESLLENFESPEANKDGSNELKDLTGKTHLMGGYGIALLRTGSGKDKVAASVYYGRSATEHAHFDKLNLELFAYGKKLIPDLGYPEHAAEGDRPGVWTKNTVAHATVVVDGRRQDTQAAGKIQHFVQNDGISLVEIDAPDTYHHTAEYRRTVALIEISPEVNYLLDLFRVSGGTMHDYSVHGFEGTFDTGGLQFSPPQETGTLAGPDVPYGSIHDDPGVADPLRKSRSYYTYRGGGYSYLYDVKRGDPADCWWADWKDEKDGVGLRASFLASDEAIHAHGDPPRKPGNPRQLDYLLLRNSGDSVNSQFISVYEPYRENHHIKTVRKLEQDDDSVTLEIQHHLGTDTIQHAIGVQGSSFTLTRTDLEGRVTRMHRIGAGSGTGKKPNLQIEKRISGKVLSVDPSSSSVEIERDRDSQPFRSRGLVKNTACFRNASRTSAYTIEAMEGKGRKFKVGFGTDSFRIGRFVITGRNADGSGLTTKTNLYMAAQGYYRGAWLTDEECRNWIPVEDVLITPHQPGVRRDSRIRLVGNHELGPAFAPGKIAYLYDFGPGDTMSIEPHATATARTDGTYRIRTNGRAEVVQ